MNTSHSGVSRFHYNKDYNLPFVSISIGLGVSRFHYNKDYNPPSNSNTQLAVYHVSIITRITTLNGIPTLDLWCITFPLK